MEYLIYEIWGISLVAYFKAFFLFLILLLVLKFLEKFILIRVKKVAKKTKTDIDDALIAIVGSIKPNFYVIISLWIAIRVLDVSNIVGKIVDVAAILVITRQIIYSLHMTSEYVISKQSEDKNSKSAIIALTFIGKLVLWSLAILILLSYFGIDITALVAGLGIGGLAIALAAQNILTDLFSSLSVYLDKPFIVGDFIEFDSTLGIVQKIGIKTTRIKSLDGEEIVVPNQKLVSDIIHNFGRVDKRRTLISLGVEYSTDSKLLKQIPATVEEIVRGFDGITFDRCHLKNFGDYAIGFELVYYVDSSDYVKYMDENQKVLFAIKDKFDSLGIEFAFPTQSIYLKK